MNASTKAVLSSSYERRYRRFKLRYPVHLLMDSGEVRSELDTTSQNVSTGGLLLESPSLVSEDTNVSFVISLTGRKLRPIQLAGEGTVVRVEAGDPGTVMLIAIEFKTPLVRIEPYLPSSTH